MIIILHNVLDKKSIPLNLSYKIFNRHEKHNL